MATFLFLSSVSLPSSFAVLSQFRHEECLIVLYRTYPHFSPQPRHVHESWMTRFPFPYHYSVMLGAIIDYAFLCYYPK